MNIPLKELHHVRYVTFNVNGVNTLFSYHPWNTCQKDLGAVFQILNADIISLQELKIQLLGLTRAGQVKRYKSFVSIPRSKKGYSGVGLYVRIPEELEPELVRASLTAVKAEEGITGCLSADKELASIGGYLSQDDLDELQISQEQLRDLDLQGRCVVVELASNTVVFSLYCPANSGGTEEGEVYRINFLTLLFRRCLNLRKAGKNVVIMGDINVSPDLIDNADAINEMIKAKQLKNNFREGPKKFETENRLQCLAFRESTPQRQLLNLFVRPSFPDLEPSEGAFLFDTTRCIHKRRLNMYTVWNTLTNARQSNYGSRIDLILSSQDNVANADILPDLKGSDHCPVFTDFDTTGQSSGPLPLPPELKLPFEAKYFYNLVSHRDIFSVFNLCKRLPVEKQEKPPEKKQKVQYTSRKKPAHPQPSISSFFAKTDLGSREPSRTPSEAPSETSSGTPSETDSKGVKLDSPSAISALLFPNPPTCHHGEKCNLRTSLTKNSKGRRFWCCPRNSKGSSQELGNHRCDFFEWAQKD